MIVFLLVVIIAILLFGAAAIKNAFAKMVSTVLIVVVLAYLWSIAASVPREVWVGSGLVLLTLLSGGLFVIVRRHRKEQAELTAFLDGSLAADGLTPDQVKEYNRLSRLSISAATEFHKNVLFGNKEQSDKEYALSTGMSDDDASTYARLIREGKYEEASALQTRLFEERLRRDFPKTY